MRCEWEGEKVIKKERNSDNNESIYNPEPYFNNRTHEMPFWTEEM